MNTTAKEAAEVFAKARRLYTQQEVEQALDRMAAEIESRLADTDPLVLCVLNGALIPMGLLLPRLGFPLRQDYIHATRYRGETSGANLEWIGSPSTSLKDEVVLIVDDILDEGITLSEIAAACRTAGASAVYTAVLVEKRHDRGNGFRADFVGLEVEDSYVFGYGMDYKEYLRNANGIYAVAEAKN